MAKDHNYPLGPQVLSVDLKVITALRQLKGYAPMNSDYTVKALDELKAEMERAEENEVNAQNVLAAARDAKAATRWALHDRVLGSKDQVIAQYGPDSDEVQSLGLKKKSKYRRATPAPTKET